MPTALPVIRGTSTALYPFTHTYMAITVKSDYQSGNTSRVPGGFPLVRFELPFNPVSQANKNTLKAASRARKASSPAAGEVRL